IAGQNNTVGDAISLLVSASDAEGQPLTFSATDLPFGVSINAATGLITGTATQAGSHTTTVIVSDGNVDIDFINNANDPIIMGIEIVELGSLSRNLDSGWNMVGIPSTPSSSNYTSVFTDVTLTGAPFEYANGAYQQVTDVETGKGYWINTSAEGNQSFSDDTVESLTLNLAEGWNMIAGPGCFIPTDAISDPSNIIIDGTLYLYEGGYELASGLLPGFGYWIQTSGAGSITMDCNGANKAGAINEESDPMSHFGKLEIKDAAEGSQTLLFGAELNDSDSFAKFLMPPKAPKGRFDVRFSKGARLNEGNEGIVLLQSDAFPLSVNLVRSPQAGSSELVIEEIVRGATVRSHSVGEGEIIEITNPDVTALKISSTDEVEEYSLPTQFALQGNYPNPFNPSTQVVFDLPEAGIIQVDVYDMLGRRVLSVPAQEMSAGANRKVHIDASELASGMYIYNVRAQLGAKTEISTGRMTLLK
nr:T9SS type A sorting domain-containing protein [Rhodothermaceae bacterium]